MSNIELIATLRCKICGDISSLNIPFNFEQATAEIQKFKEKHDHGKVDPWVI